ncbi:UNVERIFIED_CONTAM: hypothetical protein GTU68_040828 [Idotea baltica]|nr:hypothetical protein [Idotea baltica]
MKYHIYEQVLKAIEKNKNDNDCISKVSQLFPDLKLLTLSSIYAQWMQKKVKRNYHRITHPEEVLYHYDYYCKAIDEGEPPGIILRLAKQLNFSSAMLAKIILEHQLNIVAEREGVTNGVSRSQVNKLLRDTTLIQDRDLSYEVYLCLLQDDVYGPFADSIKHLWVMNTSFF